MNKKLLEVIFEKEWKLYQPNPDPAYSNVPFKIDSIEEYYNDRDKTVISHMVHIKGTARDNRDWSLDINIYELVYNNLKKWTITNDIFERINWSDSLEQIFNKAEELRREIDDK